MFVALMIMALVCRVILRRTVLVWTRFRVWIAALVCNISHVMVSMGGDGREKKNYNKQGSEKELYS